MLLNKISISFLILINCYAVIVKASHDETDSSVCEIFSKNNFEGSVISMKNLDIIYDTSLLLYSRVEKSDNKQIIVISSIKIHNGCRLLTCTHPKLKGDCQEHLISEKNVSSSDSQKLDFQSAICKCSSNLDENLDNKYQQSECAMLFSEWYFLGESQKNLFAGSTQRIKVPRVKSATVKNNCSVVLWKQIPEENKVTSLHLENSTTLLKSADENYNWYCCQCDSSSEKVCKSAQESTINADVQNEKTADFSQFVKYGKKIIGIGRNYRWKKSELAKILKEPKEPIVFLKPSTSYIEEGQQIKLPESLGTIFYEIELGVVIGKEGKSIPKSKALDHVAGYFLALDMTAKEFLKKSINNSLPWEISKGFDTAAPVSHFIPKYLIPNPNDIHLTCKINGNVTQSENTSEMIFDVPTLISYISKYMTLEPYDTILTGTPDGLGPIFNGDLIEGQLGNLTSIRFEVITVDDSTNDN